MSSYLVIARKWRPNLFEEIVGQGHVTRTLKNAVSSGRIAHAYIFSGPRGVGKTTAARILAKCLNCAEGPTPTPCNACAPCRGITSGSSVDVFEIDGASNNSVDNIRELTDGVRYLPGEGRYKIYIIDEVHMLSTPAFNALLKTLEEPPPHAVFIFATTEMHKIPATILSRCQRFDFKRIPFRDIHLHLKKIAGEEGVKIEEEALFTLAREADGSLRDAQSLLDQVLAFGAGDAADVIKALDAAEALGLMDRDALYGFSEALLARDSKACLNIVEKIYNFGYDLKRACADLLGHIRDLTVIKVTGDASLLDLPDSELERLKKTAGGFGAERLHMIFSIISKGYEEVSRSTSPRYSFEMALLRAAHSEDAKPIAELIARLEGLKIKVEGASKRPSEEPERAPEVPSSAKAVKGPEIIKDSQKEQEPPQAKTEAREGVEGVSDLIKKKIPSLAGALQSANISAREDTVEIGSGKHPVFDMKRPQLEAIISEHFGRRMKLVIKAAAAEDKGNTGKKNLPDPLVKETLKVLGGKVIEDRRRNNV